MRICRKCDQEQPIERFPRNSRGYRRHTCIDCSRAANREAQRRHYHNGGKEYIYRWYEAQGGQGVYWKRKALERRLK